MKKALPFIVLASIALAALIGILTGSPARPHARTIAFHEPTTSTVWASVPVPTTVAPTTTTAAPVKPVEVHKAVVKPVAHQVTTTTVLDGTDSTPLQVAEGQVGTRPAYADKGFWCALAVDDWAEQAHVPHWQSEDGPAALANDALRDGRAHANPQVGEMVFFNLDPEHSDAAQVSHVGLVESVNSDSIVTIQGNASSAQTVERITVALNDPHVIGFASFPS